MVRPASRHPVDPEGVRFDFIEPDTRAPAFDGVQTVFLVSPPRLADIAADMAPALATFAQRERGAWELSA